MRISIGITAFNEAEYLREAIESVLAQTFQPVEIIVVDDGSTDHTREVCESFGSKVTYVYHENDGTLGGSARALSIEKSKTDWVALLDQDDLWLPDKLEKQAAAIKEFPNVGAVFTRHQAIDDAGSLIDEVETEPVTGKVLHMSPENAFHFLLKGNPYCPSSVLVDRNVFTRGGFVNVHDPGCGDWETWLRIAHDFPIAVVDERLTRYRVHSRHSCTNKHFLASGLELTLARQRARLHPNCEQCRMMYHAGEEHVAHVFAVAARTYLDQYFATTRDGQVLNALPFLRGALQTSPREVFRPRRLLAVIKNFAVGTTRRARNPRVQH